VTDAAVNLAMERDLNGQPERDRTFLRYFSIVPLYNAGVPEAELEGYRVALGKLINSLSWHRIVTRPKPIDPARTLFRIDLRDYNWTPDTWNTLARSYPYGVNALALATVTSLCGADTPVIRADWFVATASIPPLYHDLLGLPKSVQELEKMLGVDSARNLAQEKNVARAGMRTSGVSRNNRVVERHISGSGAYWKSYDFKGNDGDQNIFRDPLHFSAAGGEMVFNLPNGMQGYYISTTAGDRLDSAPVNIVADRNYPEEPAVINGRSCMACHYAGIKRFKDDIREVVQKIQDANFDRDKALALYPPQADLERMLDEDTHRFNAAIEQAGGAPTLDFRTEPINALARTFRADLNLRRAAAELGVEEDAFRQRLASNRALADLGLGQLLVANGGVKRDVWEQAYSSVVRELQFPSTGLPRGLVAWWSGDGDASDSISRIHSVANAGVGFAPGVLGRGMLFDGKTARVAVDDAEELKLTGSLSLTAWIDAAPGVQQTIIFRGDNRASLDPYWLAVAANGDLVFHIGSLQDQEEIHTPIPTGRFVAIAGTLDVSAGKMRVYVDGKMVAEKATRLRPLRDLDARFFPGLGLGNSQQSPQFNVPFRGVIDEMQIYRRALTADEVAGLYHNQLAAATGSGTVTKLSDGYVIRPGQPATPVTPDPAEAADALVPPDGAYHDILNVGDMEHWRVEGIPWDAVDGALRSPKANDRDLLRFDQPFPSDDVGIELQVRVRSGMRLRVFLGNFYLGNETGDGKVFNLHGAGIKDVQLQGDVSCNYDVWYVLRLTVARDGRITLYKNGEIVATAARKESEEIRLKFSPGDGFSQGVIDVSKVRVRIGPSNKPK
jgi:hypothetical protein